MAFQAGEIKISGTIDGFSFYNSVYGWLIRRKGGPTSKRFKTSPAFERSRENSEEFTACSKAASAVRKLVILHCGIADKSLYHRLIKLMRLLADHDQLSVRGRRDPLKGISTAKGLARLKDFEITVGLNLYDILSGTDLLKDVQQDKSMPTRIPSASIRRRRRNRCRVLASPVAFMPVHYRRQVLVNTAFG